MSSIKTSAVRAALAVLALIATINVVASDTASAPNVTENDSDKDVWLQYLSETDGGQLRDSEEHIPESMADGALDGGSGIKDDGDEFGWVEFPEEDSEHLELKLAHQRRARSLSRLSELRCAAEVYPLVTLIEGTYVQLMSPGYPGVYPKSTRCGWKILTDASHVIRIICPAFQLGRGDFVLLKDYKDLSNLRFNDVAVMKNVTTTSYKVFLGFKSDAEGEGKGFMCLVRSLPNTLPVKSLGPIENVVESTELEVPNFKRRSGLAYIDEGITKSTGNVAGKAAVGGSVSELPTAESKSSGSMDSSLNEKPKSQEVITKEYLLGLKRKAQEEGIKPNSAWMNKPYAQVKEIKTYTVRSGSNTIDMGNN